MTPLFLKPPTFVLKVGGKGDIGKLRGAPSDGIWDSVEFGYMGWLPELVLGVFRRTLPDSMCSYLLAFD